MHIHRLCFVLVCVCLLSSAHAQCPAGFRHLDANPFATQEAQQQISVLSKCYQDIGWSENAQACSNQCEEQGGGQICLNNSEELDAMLYTFNLNDQNDLLVQNTFDGDDCWKTNNWDRNDPATFGSAYLSEADCYLSGRCICQSEWQSCQNRGNWQDLGMYDQVHGHGWPFDTEHHHHYYTSVQHYYHDHMHGSSWTINMEVAPEAFSFVLFVVFFSGSVMTILFLKFARVSTKRYPLTALMCGFFTLGSISFAPFAARDGDYGHRLDGLALSASITGGLFTSVAAMMEKCSCCSHAGCCTAGGRVGAVRVMYAVGAFFSAMDFFAMAVDAGHSACSHGHGSRHTCTIKAFQIFFALFYALQAAFLGYLSHLHAATRTEAALDNSQSAPGSAPTSADTVIYLGAGSQTHEKGPLHAVARSPDPSPNLSPRPKPAWMEPESPPAKTSWQVASTLNTADQNQAAQHEALSPHVVTQAGTEKTQNVMPKPENGGCRWA